MTLDDMASEREEQHREAALLEQFSRSIRYRMTPIGECYYCGDDDIGHGHLFCSKECKHDWERAERQRNIAGIR